MSVHITSQLGALCYLHPTAQLRSAVTVIACPTYYVEYRGWSQEVNTLHLEMVKGDKEPRFSATGRRTPFDPEDQTLTVKGFTPDDAIQKFREALEHEDWEHHYAGIRKRIDRMQDQIDKLEAAATSPQQPAASPSTAPSSPAAS